MLTQALVHEWFDYNENLGELFWRKSPKPDILVGHLAGNVRADGYIDVGFQGGRYLMHRLIFLYHHGYLPDLIDHKDRNNRNNRIDNLVPASKAVNAHNSDKSFGAIPFRGVSFDKAQQRYVSYITSKGKRRFLGYFDTPEEASAIYVAEQLKLRKEVV